MANEVAILRDTIFDASLPATKVSFCFDFLLMAIDDGFETLAWFQLKFEILDETVEPSFPGWK